MIKRITLLAAAAIVAITSAYAEPWNIDRAHSSVMFSVKHMVVTTVHGQFTDFGGTLDWDGKNPAKGSVEFTIQAASINTDNERRDKHLKSPDFFAVDSFPTLTFKSTQIVPGDGSNFKLVGDLTVRGVTKQVTFDCTYNGSTVGMGGTTIAAFSAATTINRQDFHVSWSKTLDSGGLVAGNEVKIEVELEVNNAKMDKK